MNETASLICVILSILIFVLLAAKYLWGYLAPVKTVKARVCDKFKSEQFSKIYSTAARPVAYTVVFESAGKKRSFRVSAFSYDGYRIGEKGTLKYRGNRLIDFR